MRRQFRLFLFGAILISQLSAVTVNALPEVNEGFQWIDRSTIAAHFHWYPTNQDIDVAFTDPEWFPDDEDNTYHAKMPDGCISTITLEEGNPGDGSAHLYWWANYKRSAPENNCFYDFAIGDDINDTYNKVEDQIGDQSGHRDVIREKGGAIEIKNIKNLDRGKVNFYLVGDTLISSDDHARFKRDPNDERNYLLQGDDDCQDNIKLDKNAAAGGERDGTFFRLTRDDRNCKPTGDPSEIPVFLGNIANRPDLPQNQEEVDKTLTAATGGKEGCSFSFSLQWIVCSITEAILGVVDSMQNDIVKPLLTLNPLDRTAVGISTVYEIWGGVRNLANVALIIIFFVVIFYQAFGVEAYAVKRMIPRLIAGVILINISWYIVAILVDMSNILGSGLGALISGIAKQGTWNVLDPNALASSSLVQAGTFGALLAGAGILITGTLFLLAIPVFLAFIGIVFALLFRSILVYLLAVVSPIAFLAWILPNTENLWRQWWSYLTKTLLMFPLIVLLFAAGKVAGVVAIANPKLGTNVGSLVALIAAIIPLLLIPATFRMAGGAMAMVGGAITNLRQRASKPLRARAGEKARSAFHEMQMGHRFSEGSRFGKIANPFLRATTNPLSYAPGRLGNKRKGLLEEGRSNAAIEMTQRLQKAGISRDQVLYQALSRAGGGEHELRQYADHLKAIGDTEGAQHVKDNISTLKPFLGKSAAREAAFNLAVADGYPDEEDFAAASQGWTDANGNHHAAYTHDMTSAQRIVKTAQRNSKQLNAQFYGMKVMDDGHGHAKLVNDIAATKRVADQLSDRDRIVMKTRASITQTTNEDLARGKEKVVNGKRVRWGGGIDTVEDNTTVVSYDKDAKAVITADGRADVAKDKLNLASQAGRAYKDLDRDYNAQKAEQEALVRGATEAEAREAAATVGQRRVQVGHTLVNAIGGVAGSTYYDPAARAEHMAARDELGITNQDLEEAQKDIYHGPDRSRGTDEAANVAEGTRPVDEPPAE